MIGNRGAGPCVSERRRLPLRSSQRLRDASANEWAFWVQFPHGETCHVFPKKESRVGADALAIRTSVPSTAGTRLLRSHYG